MVLSRWAVAAVLLQIASLVASHGGDAHQGMDMGDTTKPEDPGNGSGTEGDSFPIPSYAGLDMYGGLILAHIILMVLAWVFILPIGKSIKQCWS